MVHFNPWTANAAWLYVWSCSKAYGTPPSTRPANKTCPFPIPSNTPAGTYELRLLSNNGYTRLATSNPFTVTAPASGRRVDGPSLLGSPPLVVPGAERSATARTALLGAFRLY